MGFACASGLLQATSPPSFAFSTAIDPASRSNAVPILHPAGVGANPPEEGVSKNSRDRALMSSYTERGWVNLLHQRLRARKKLSVTNEGGEGMIRE